ncbi:MAG: 50S ribosomal protein L24 [Anaerolineales bacterium]
MRIKKGDTVEVIRGKDRGKRGQVLHVLPREERLVVEGINLRKKHKRQVQTQGSALTPGVVEFPAAFHASAVLLVCPKCGETTRIGRQKQGEVWVRVCKHCQAVMDA